MIDKIKLRESSILHVPLQNYENNFTFIVNNERFLTNHLVSDLISPKISKMHAIDATIEKYYINTNSTGDFNTILKLATFHEQQISKNDIPFIIEVLEKLENTTSVEFNIKEYDEESNNSILSSLKSLSKYQEYPNFYNKKISEKVDTISSQIYKMNEEGKKIFKTLDFYIIEKIINNSNLSIESEDQLVELIIELCLKKSKFCELFSYVYFVNVSSDVMKKFFNHIMPDELTREAWTSLSERLSQEIVKPKKTANQEQTRYKKAVLIEYKNEPFEGIINHFNKNSNIKEEIDISFSSRESEKVDQWRIIRSEEKEACFYTEIEENPFICIEFKKHTIIPTHYTIRAGADNSNPRKFVIEGSNNNKDWTLIDKNKNCTELRDRIAVHTFSIKKEVAKPFKFIRIRHYGINWNNRNLLQIRSLEFFGKIF